MGTPASVSKVGPDSAPIAYLPSDRFTHHKPMKTSRYSLPPVVCALGAAIFAALSATSSPAQTIEVTELQSADPIVITPPTPGPTLRAGNITAESPHHDVKLYFPWWPGIDDSTIGDGDIIARGPNGYHQKASFVSMERVSTHFPVPGTDFTADTTRVLPAPQPQPILVVTYRFYPPEGPGDLWTDDDNGGYAVRLVRGEIATTSGRFLPPKFLGGFRCLIRTGPGRPVQPEATRCAIGRHHLAATDPDNDAIGYHALVGMTFLTPHVEIDWGDVVQTGNIFIANATAVSMPIVSPDPIPISVPLAAARVDSISNTLPTGADSFLPTFRHRYRFGALAPGDYQFVFRVNGEEECVRRFIVPRDPPIDVDPPEAELEVRNITQATDEPQRFAVTYKDRSGIDASTIGDGDLVVFSPGLFLDSVDPIPSNWRAQRARLVEIIPLSDDRSKLKAIYEIDPPTRGWTHEHNGFYPVALWDDAVCDRLGNCAERQRLGGFEVAIDPDTPPVPAVAEIRVDASNPDRVVAKVHVDFRGHWAITSQHIRRDGNRIYLIAQAEPLAIIAIFPPPPPPSEDLLYEIGPLRKGEHVAAFLMNGHLYDAEKFTVRRSPPIDADVALDIDSSDPSNVFAIVKIQFRTPHYVAQETVERQGHRIILPAKARPLPIALDTAIRPPLPEPIYLRYPIGALPPGGYLGAFVMNDYPYTVQDFVVEDPGPPINAEAHLRVDQSDPNNTVVEARIAFRSPHTITERDIHRVGSRFILEATAAPIQTFAPIPLPQIITIRYPLGALDPGQYGAAFVMNGYPYATTSWVERDDTFEADVTIAVEETSTGNWGAKVTVLFANPQVRISDPGDVEFDGHILRIHATAVLSATADVPPPGGYVFDYDLGHLEPGAYWLKYFINDHFEKQNDFFVQPPPPIPAKVDLSVDTSEQPVIATARIQFEDHYRIASQATHRFGNLFILDATAEGPLPILAPIPPPPIDVDYDLGDLSRGVYYAAFRMNGHFYAVETFRVDDGGFEAKVDLSVEIGEAVKLKAVIDIDDPYVIITNPGTPVVSGNLIKINATAERVNFVTEPSGDPQTFHYRLHNLRPGPYRVVYCINGEPEAHLGFVIPRDPPLANVSHIKIAQGDASWFAEVGVILLPGQEVTDWGEVRHDGNTFYVNITVDWVDFAPPIEPLPIPLPSDRELLVGMDFDSAGNPLVGGFPVRLVTHSYVLGVLDPGHYGFIVLSRGHTVAAKRFEVPGSPPRVELSAGNITEATDEFRFGLSYYDPTGLDHDSVRHAEIVVHGPDGYREVARLLSYASTDDVPSSSASARYALNGPGGDWDFPDNGRYFLHVDPTQIRDLQGNHIENGRLGSFRVRILPPSEPGVNVSVAMNSTGEWEATVEIISEPGEQVVVDSWGPVIHHGQSFIALASVHFESTTGPVEPVANTYNLGTLQPGYYVFVFKSDEAHCGFAGFTVPGLEGDPLDNWRHRIAGAATANDEDADQDGLDFTGEYFFVTDPNRPDLPAFSPEIVRDADDRSHLALRFRRLLGAEGVTQVVEGSRRLEDDWDDVSALTEIVERTPDIDGTEEVVLCLRSPLSESPYHFLRIKVIRSQE